MLIKVLAVLHHSAPSPNKLLIFTRYPQPGNTKTRLIPALGPHGAAQLQQQMTEHVVDQAIAFQSLHPCTLEIRYTGGDRDQMQSWLGSGLQYTPQGHGNLGDRLRRALAENFSSGFQRLVVIGADCPAIQPRHLQQAFEQLHAQDLVIGPATDGGYYLIGLQRLWPALFHQTPWGTDQVLRHTQNMARRLRLSWSKLEPLCDIDRPEDLATLEKIRLAS